MTLSCRRVRRQLDTWFELGEAEKARLLKHAQGCPACERAVAEGERLFGALETTRQIYRALRAHGELTLPPRPAPERRITWSWLRPRAVWWAFAAASCAAACAVVWLALVTVRDHRAGVHPGGSPVTLLAGVGTSAPVSAVGAARASVRLPVSMSGVSRMVRERVDEVKEAGGVTVPRSVKLPPRPSKGGATWFSRGDFAELRAAHV